MPRKQLPVQTVPGQAYGQAQMQAQAQQAIPLPNAQPGPPSTAPQPGPAGPPSGADILALAQAAQGGVPLTAPTQRPDEPVTAGLPFGPGPGPEAIAGLFQVRRNQAADTLEQLAAYTGDAWMQQMAQKARMGG